MSAALLRVSRALGAVSFSGFAVLRESAKVSYTESMF